jgi:hypothetical protein
MTIALESFIRGQLIRKKANSTGCISRDQDHKRGKKLQNRPGEIHAEPHSTIISLHFDADLLKSKKKLKLPLQGGASRQGMVRRSTGSRCLLTMTHDALFPVFRRMCLP